MKLNIGINKGSLAVFFFILIVSSEGKAQDSINPRLHSVTLKTQFTQIKDAFNYGLVYNGLQLAGCYAHEKTINEAKFIYQSELNFGVNTNIGTGVAWGISPVDIFWGYDVSKTKTSPFLLGAYFLTDYKWQLYPDLQSGHMFWFTSIEIGPQAIFSLPVKNRKLRILASNSLVGFTSRPEPATETYYYSLKFSDFVSNAHSNFNLGFGNLFNHTNLEIELLNKIPKRLSLAYAFEYFGYFGEPRFGYLTHALNLKWRIGSL